MNHYSNIFVIPSRVNIQEVLYIDKKITSLPQSLQSHFSFKYIQCVYLESVLELHHAAVEEGRGKLRWDAQDFGHSVAALRWN